MSFFERDGIQYHYEITGEGPAIVFTHGPGGDLSLPKDLLGKLGGYRLPFAQCPSAASPSQA